MSLSRLLPKSAARKKEKYVADLIYLWHAEFHLSYSDFCETPIPVIFKMLETHKKRVQQMKRKKK